MTLGWEIGEIGWDSTRAPLATDAAQHASAHHGADATGAAANASEQARACLEQPSVIWAGSHRAGLVPNKDLPNKDEQPSVIWAGSHRAGLVPNTDLPNKGLPSKGTSRAEAVRRQLLDAVRAHLVKVDPTAAEWVGNLSVHLDERPTQRSSNRAAESAPRARASPNAQHSARASPNAWVVFPTYHGERQKFNGYPCSFPLRCPSGRYELPLLMVSDCLAHQVRGAPDDL